MAIHGFPKLSKCSFHGRESLARTTIDFTRIEFDELSTTFPAYWAIYLAIYRALHTIIRQAVQMTVVKVKVERRRFWMGALR